MPTTVFSGFTHNFLGNAPAWYKQVIILFLIANPLIVWTLGPAVAGLLAIEALLIGMTTADAVYHEVLVNFPVILLLMFMVAGIYFMKELLLPCFRRFWMH